MKIRRGNYDGASEFAYFDKPVQAMTLEECQSLLSQILYQAMPGEENAHIVYAALKNAEQCWKEQR